MIPKEYKDGVRHKCVATKTIKFKNGLNFFEGYTYGCCFNYGCTVSYEDGRFQGMSEKVFNDHFEVIKK